MAKGDGGKADAKAGLGEARGDSVPLRGPLLRLGPGLKEPRLALNGSSGSIHNVHAKSMETDRMGFGSLRRAPARRLAGLPGISLTAMTG